jgi:hypothetical protein
VAKAQNKTRPTAVAVDDYLAQVTPDVRREDARTLVELMGRLTGEPAAMWGPSIVGFGVRQYRYESGREGEVPRVGFAPRKPATVLYIPGAMGAHAALTGRLGRFSHGKGCIYVKRLADVDMGLLETLIAASIAE